MTTRRFAVLAVVCVASCSVGPKTAAPVEPEKARAALRTTLDAWKAGKPIASLTEASPPIVAQDFDWLAGSKLEDYTVIDDKESDANLRVRVQLSVRSAQGTAAKKTVTYVVGTDPSLTVFRAPE